MPVNTDTAPVAATGPSDKAPSGRRVLLYFAWSHPDEARAPLFEIEDRFPALFELRRLFYPQYEALAQPASIDQGISGFLDHVQKRNFAGFAEHVHALSGHPALQVERESCDGRRTPLDRALLSRADTVVIISFDSLRTAQAATLTEIGAVADFLEHDDHLLFLCPHHDIGAGEEPDPVRRSERRLSEHRHHGDVAIPPRQGFGGFARSLLVALGMPVENRYGLRPAVEPDGSPSSIDVDAQHDDLALLRGVRTFNLHPHLPQLSRIGPALSRLDVLARQRIDRTAPAHPFSEHGRDTFDAMLQSNARACPGKVVVCDTTLFSSRAGGLDSLQRFWTNIVLRPRRGGGAR